MMKDICICIGFIIYVSTARAFDLSRAQGVKTHLHCMKFHKSCKEPFNYLFALTEVTWGLLEQIIFTN